MPGTNYNNDHSFINRLSSEKRNACFGYIKTSSLSKMIEDKIFIEKNISNLPFDEVDRLDVINSCIIAKATCMIVNDFYPKKHIEWLLKEVLSAISECYKKENFANQELISCIQFEHPRTFQWIQDVQRFNRLRSKRKF